MKNNTNNTMEEFIICTKCKKEIPFHFRPIDKRRLDGHSGHCNNCVADYYRKYFQDKPEKMKSKLVNQQKYFQKNKEKWIEKFYKQREKYPEKIKARTLLRNSVYRGKIIKQPCKVCGEEKVQGHHEDYSKPLEVIWLCSKCHKKHHEK